LYTFLKTNKQLWVDASYGGSKMARVPVQKVHVNGKINIKMEKYVKNQCLMGCM
jgi:hypothetical protein